MIFENLPHSCVVVILLSLLIGFVLAFMYFYHELSDNRLSSVIKASLAMGLGLGLALSVAFCSFVPTLVTIDRDSNHNRSFSLFANGDFLGVGGSYILNNSQENLRLVGIESYDDINVRIGIGEVQKVRRCPQRYFVPVPNTPHDLTRRSLKGRKKSIEGPRVFLIKD